MKSLVNAFLQIKNENRRGITFIQSSTEEKFVSYKNFAEQTKRSLSNLFDSGVRKGDELVLLLENNEHFLLAFWACLLGGIKPVPLAIGSTPDQKRKFLKVWPQLKTPWVLCEDSVINKILELEEVDEIKSTIRKHKIDVSSLLKRGKKYAVEKEIAGEDIAYIQYSSGSTGNPKGVTLTHNNLCYNVNAIVERSNTSITDSALSWMPLTHDMGLICFHLASLVAGIDQYLIPTKLFIRRPLLWINKASEHRISQLYSSNFGIQFFLSAYNKSDDFEWNLSNLRLLYNGAEQISKNTCDQFIQCLRTYGISQNVIFPGYGLAEASVAVTLPNPGEALKSHLLEQSSLQMGKKVDFNPNGKDVQPYVEVGYPVNDCEIRITHQNKSLTENYLGNIEVRGKNVTQGYYDTTSEVDQFFEEGGWLKTGDLGFIHEGNLVVTGRSKNLIILNGVNYFPHDIEHILLSLSEIKRGYVAATSCWDADLGRELLLIFVIASNKKKHSILFEKIRNRIREQLGFSPDYVVPVQRIPKTTSGKVQYYKLKEDFLRSNQPIESSQETPEPDLEIPEEKSLITEILRVLGEKEPTLSFYENGTTSLRLIQFITQLNYELNITLSMSDLIENNTPKKLARYLLKKEHSKLPIKRITAAEKKASYPVHPNQRTAWTFEQNEVTKGAFNISILLSLQREIEKRKLTDAIQGLIDFHETLRSGFKHTDDELQLFIRSRSNTSFFLEEQSCFSIDEFEEKKKEEANREFDLSTDILLRATWWNVSESQNDFLQITIHHIITDGWSIELLLQDLSALYYDHELIQPTFQLVDYIEWYNSIKSKDFYKRSLLYWSNELKEGFPTLVLPYSSSRNKRDHQTETQEILLDALFLDAVDKFGQSQNVSRFAVLLSMLHATFYVHNQQSIISTGVEVANRVMPETKDIQGQLTNTLLIRSTFKSNQNLSDLVHQVHENLHNGLANSLVAIEDLPTLLEMHNVEFSKPLFNTLIIYQDFEDIGTKTYKKFWKDNLKLVKPDKSLTDLLVEFIKEENHVRLSIQYDTGLFTSEMIHQFISHYIQLSQQWLQQTSIALDKVNVLPTAEVEQLMKFSNGKTVPHRRIRVSDILLETFNNYDSRCAIVDGETQFTYSELGIEIERIAAILYAESGKDSPPKIAFVGSNSLMSVMVMLSCWRIGGTYIPIDKNLPDARINYMLEDSLADIVIGEGDRSITKNITKVISTSELKNKKSPQSNNLQISEFGPAYILYTSGTTGKPKGVVISQDNLSNYLQAFCSYFHLSKDDIVVQQASISFDTQFEEILPILYSGGKLVIAPNGGKDVEELIDIIDREKVTVLSTSPAIIGELNHLQAKLLSLRLLISGGDTLKSHQLSHLKNLNCLIFNTYGPTETTICATFGEVSSHQKLISIGKPIDNKQVFILNENQQLSPIYEEGEIYIGGEGLAEGYLNRDDLTSEKFVEHPFDQNRKLYRTSDKGRWLENGTIEFLGRDDDQVKIRGQRVECGEVEHAISSLGYSSVVTVYQKLESEKQLIAYLLKREKPELEYMKNQLYEILPSYMVPDSFVLIDSIPKNTNGKVIKSQLPSPEVKKPEFEDKKFITANQKKLYKIWEQLLKPVSLNLQSSFVAEGGHSIKITRLISEVKRQFGIRLSLEDVFENQKFDQMVALIESELPLAEQPISIQPKQEFYPISDGQKRLWAIHQHAVRKTAYNIVIAHLINRPIDLDKVDDVLTNILSRHDSLRSSFPVINGKPVMQLMAVENMSDAMIKEDWTELTDKDERIQSSIYRELNHTFDLVKGPLVRFCVIKKAEGQFFLLLNIHHIISDGWSVDLLLKETISELCHLTPPKSRGDLQYQDFVFWEKEQLGGDRTMKAFWKKYLSDAPSECFLPKDFDHHSIPLYEGKEITFEMEESNSALLKEYAIKYETTNYVVLLASLLAVLHKQLDSKDIMLGTYVSGRNHPDLTEQLGFFVNTMPIRSKLEEEQTFEDLIVKVHENMVSCLEHSTYSLNRILDNKTSQHKVKKGQIFEMVFAYENRIDSYDQLPELNIKPIKVESNTSKFKVTFTFVEKETLTFKIEYATKFYEEATIRRFYKHYDTFLKGLLKNPEKPLDQISLVSDDEKRRLLSFNPTAVQIKSLSLLDQFQKQVQNGPDKTAVTCKNTSLTYHQLDKSSNILSHYLKKIGVAKGDIVGLCLSRSEVIPQMILAVMKVGAQYMALDPDYPQTRLTYMFEDTSPKWVVTNREYRSKFDRYDFVEVFDLEDFDLTIDIDSVSPVLLNQDDFVYVMFTSGSTGKPKGVPATQKNVLDQLAGFQSKFKLNSNDRFLSNTNYTFDPSVLEYLLTLCNGATLIISTNEERQSLDRLLTLFDQHKPTYFQATPTILSSLINAGWNGYKKLIILTGGEQLPLQLSKELLKRSKALYNLYGPTETTIWSTLHEMKPEDEKVMVGKPIGNTGILILDEEGDLVPVGTIGEICILGEGVSIGYLNREVETKENFIEHPLAKSSKLYKTGDLGRWDEDGLIEFKGRIDNQVKIRGHRVELEEIEFHLKAHELVKEVVVGLREINASTEIVAYVVYQSQEDTHALRNYLLEKVPQHMVPALFVTIDAIPVNSNGKVDRKSLSKLEIEETTTSNEIAIEMSEMEEKLAACLQQIFPNSVITPSTNFFDLGGHSLLAMRLCSLVATRLYKELSIKEIFERPVLKDLALLLEKKLNKAGSPIIVDDNEEYPLSYNQLSLWVADEKERDKTAYNIFGGFRIKGLLDLDRFVDAFYLVWERHEILRTNFKVLDDGRVLQKTNSANRSNATFIEVLNWTSNKKPWQKVQSFLKEEALRRFDLKEEHLLKVLLIKVGDADHALIINMHHIISDGWSIELITREVRHNYEALKQDESFLPPPLLHQYKDYANWQNNWLENGGATSHEKYWLSKFPDGIQTVDLSRIASVNTYSGEAGRIFLELDKNDIEAIKSKIRIHKLTPNVFFITAWQIVLNELTKETSITLGMPFANRDPGSMDQIGYYVNTQLISKDVDRSKKLIDLLNDTMEEMMVDLQYQEYPLPLLVSKLRELNKPVSDIVFNIGFSWMEYEEALWNIEGLDFELLEIPRANEKTTLWLAGTAVKGDIKLSLEYDTSIISSATAELIIRKYQMLMHEMKKDIERPITQIDMMLEEERRDKPSDFENLEFNL